MKKPSPVGVHNVAVGDATDTHSGIGGGVVGQFFDNEAGRVRVHLRGKRYIQAKALISMKKSTCLGYFSGGQFFGGQITTKGGLAAMKLPELIGS